MEQEEWRPVVGFPGYAVSSHGRVYSVPRKHARKGTYTKIFVNKNGYCRVALQRDKRLLSRSVHRLLLKAFIGSCPPGKETGHLNGIRDDNRLANLAWITHSENIRMKKEHGTDRYLRGSEHCRAKLQEDDVRDIRAAYRRYDRQSGMHALARKYGVDHSAIYKIVHRKNWSHV